MYQQIYNLLNQYLYDFEAPMQNSTAIACDLLASIATIFIVSLPFIIVWRVIKGIC